MSAPRSVADIEAEANQITDEVRQTSLNIYREEEQALL